MRRRKTIILVGLFFLAMQGFAQVPLGINYQGVARSADGSPLVNQIIGLRVSITSGPNGSIDYIEEHHPETNEFGLFSVVVGQGQSSGSIGDVNWGEGNKWLQIEVDPEDNANYMMVGTQQVMSVPYALFAAKSGESLTPGFGIDIINGQVINLLPDKPMTLTGTGSATVTGTYPNFTINATDNVDDADADPANEIQTLSKTGTTVTLSNGGGSFTDEVNDADADPANEIQTLTKTGNTVTLSNGGGSFTDAVNDADADATNELLQSAVLTGTNLVLTDAAGSKTVDLSSLQDGTGTDNQNLSSTASGTDRTINISGGTGTTFSVADNDNSTSNELQTISRTGATVTLSNGGGSVSIDDADADATNELQTISKAGNTVTLSNGGGSFTDAVNDADADPANELQTISKVGNTVTLSDGGGSFIDAVNDADANAANELNTAATYEANNTLRITDAGGNIDVPLGTLNADLDANLNTVSNLKDPVAPGDAVNLSYLETKVATDYAFKTLISETGTGANLTFDLSVGIDFDEGGLILGTQISISETGIYLFNVKGSSTANAPIVINRNGIEDHQVGLINVGKYFDAILLKLNAGDIIELRALPAGNGETLNLEFFGYKI